ncbi:MAG: DUF3299 domain-containing protein [Bacteroidota bacterium]
MSRINMGWIRFSISFFLLLGAISLHGQLKISWDVLADVTFTEEYDKELNAYWLIPTFGKKLKTYRNKNIILEGYFIPVDAANSFFVLSKNPYAACFFCGAAGPETIVEIQPKDVFSRRLRLDDRIRLKGKLKLNKRDFNHCNYILADAELLSN